MLLPSCLFYASCFFSSSPFHRVVRRDDNLREKWNGFSRSAPIGLRLWLKMWSNGWGGNEFSPTKEKEKKRKLIFQQQLTSRKFFVPNPLSHPRMTGICFAIKSASSINCLVSQSQRHIPIYSIHNYIGSWSFSFPLSCSAYNFTTYCFRFLLTYGKKRHGDGEAERNINKIIHVSLCSRIVLSSGVWLWSAWCENCKNIIHMSRKKCNNKAGSDEKEIPKWNGEEEREETLISEAIALRGK